MPTALEVFGVGPLMVVAVDVLGVGVTDLGLNDFSV
jgi:hypothetical protein